jgi:hypothetical protein
MTLSVCSYAKSRMAKNAVDTLEKVAFQNRMLEVSV